MWEEDEDRRYDGALRSVSQMCIHVPIVETQQSRLNSSVAMLLQVSSVDPVDWRCQLMMSTP